MTMRLLNLQISGFRGFCAATEPINFDGDLVLFFGPNGFGKTSLSEAIEWLLYGSTKRRKRGEQLRRSEYVGCYTNVHHLGTVEVSATILQGTNAHTICRQLLSNENSVTRVDGRPATFESIGILPIEALYPVIAQHGLQSFIHSKPEDRRDAISAVLGLDNLVVMKSSLDSARSSFQRTPPKAVADARLLLSQISEGLLGLPETSEIAKRWRKVPTEISISEDIAGLMKAARRLAGSTRESVADLLDDLRLKRSELSRSVFDIEAFGVAELDIQLTREIIAPTVKLNRALKNIRDCMLRYLTTASSRVWHRTLGILD